MGAETSTQINSSMPNHVFLWAEFKLSACFAIAICLLSTGFVTTTSSAQERVRVGTSSRGFGALPIYVADKKGFYAKFGLRPEMIIIRSSVAVPALLSGDLDYYNGVQPAVSAALKGLPIKLVMMGGEKVIFLVLVKPEVRTLNDLRGKTIGVSAIGSTVHFSLLKVLNHFGFEAGRDINLLAAGDVRSQLAALQTGKIDAASHGPPLDSLGIHLGYKVLLWDKDYVDIPISGLDVSERYLQSSPDQVKRMIKSLIEAQRFIRKQKEESTRLIAEWMSVDQSTAENLYQNLGSIFSSDGTMKEATLRATIQMESELTKTKYAVPLTTISDSRLLLDAQQELRKDGILQ